jgi:hypothetical protein
MKHLATHSSEAHNSVTLPSSSHFTPGHEASSGESVHAGYPSCWSSCLSAAVKALCQHRLRERLLSSALGTSPAVRALT